VTDEPAPTLKRGDVCRRIDDRYPFKAGDIIVVAVWLGSMSGENYPLIEDDHGWIHAVKHLEKVTP